MIDSATGARVVRPVLRRLSRVRGSRDSLRPMSSIPAPRGPGRNAVRRRPVVLAMVVVGVLAFAVSSLVLARGLSGAGTERARVLDLLDAQARGDADAALDRLPACRRQPACAELTRARVRDLRRPGRVEILAFEPSTRLTPTGHTGPARVAWRAGTGRPVVQCVRVRREGPLAGGDVELLSISDPIESTAPCAGGA